MVTSGSNKLNRTVAKIPALSFRIKSKTQCVISQQLQLCFLVIILTHCTQMQSILRKKHINMEITAKLVHHFQLECTPAVKRHESVFV